MEKTKSRSVEEWASKIKKICKRTNFDLDEMLIICHGTPLGEMLELRKKSLGEQLKDHRIVDKHHP